jgi:hypothetical protein
MNLQDYFPRGEIVTGATLSCLREPHTPMVLRLKVRPRKEPGFVRREDLEPAEGAVKARVMNCIVDRMVLVDESWKELDETETAIENCAWRQGAWDMVRHCNPPLGDDWAEPGHGVTVQWGGIESVYNIPGSPGQRGDKIDYSLAERAGREGYWSWTWKPNCFLPAEDVLLKIALRGDSSLRPDGSRDGDFPGWMPTGKFAGRSGQWWLGLVKSFETTDDPGQSLRIVFDFRKRQLALGK